MEKKNNLNHTHRVVNENEYQALLKQLKNQKSELISTTDHRDRLRNNNAKLKNEVEELTKKIEASEHKISKITEAGHYIRNSQNTQIDKLEKKIVKMNQVIKLTLTKYNDVTKQLSNMKKQINQLKEKNSNLMLQKKNPDSEGPSNNISEQFESYAKRIQELQHEVYNQNQQIDKLSSLNQQLTKSQHLFFKQPSQENRQNTELDELRKENYDLKQKIETYENNTMPDTDKEIRDENIQLKTELRNLKLKLAMYARPYASLDSEKEDIQPSAPPLGM